MPKPPARALLPAVLLLLVAPTVAAQPAERFERLWSRARLHTGGEDAFIRSVDFSGRFQLDQAYVDGGGASHSETSVRRLRLGAKATLRGNVVVHAEAEYDPAEDPAYRRLTDAYVAWNPSDAVELTVGKHGAPFTMDGMTSSKELIAIDRSNLTNNIWFTSEYMPGVSVAGAVDRWRYHLGVYSSGEENRGFGDSNGGEFTLGTVGYDFGGPLAAERALLSLNLVRNDPDPRNTFTRPLEKVASLNFDYAAGRFNLRADVAIATGYLGQSDLRALMAMPFYDLSDAVQLVARYTRVESDEPNGVRFAAYEREIEPGRGDEYREIYFGLNYYWHGHRLKLQTGLQYADMRDRAGDGGAYTGWAWTTGLRVSW